MKMDPEESLLRPCKSLPPPLKDHDALQNRTSPHLGSISSTQVEMAPGANASAKDIEGSSVAQEDDKVKQEIELSMPPKGNETESAATMRKKGPLQLLDLPLDILKDIFKEVGAGKEYTSRLCANSTSRSHTRATCVVLPLRVLPYILLLPLSSIAGSI